MKRNTQKRTRRVSLAVALVLTVAVLFGTLLGISGIASETVNLPDVSATTDTEGNAYLDIYATNVDYEEYMHLYYAVAYNFGELALDKANIKMAFYTAQRSAYTKDNANYTADVAVFDTVTPAGGEAREVAVLRSADIPAASIVDTLYARAYIEDGDKVYYSEVLKYSVLQYVQDRFLDAKEDAGSVTKSQMDLYEKTLTYGANAQQVLGYKTDRLANAPYLYLTVSNGKLADGTDKALLLPDEVVDVYASKNYNGKQFLFWRDQNGGEYGESLATQYVAGAIDANTAMTIAAIYTGDAVPGFAIGKTEADATAFGEGLSSATVVHPQKFTVSYEDIHGKLVPVFTGQKNASTGENMTIYATNKNDGTAAGMVFDFDFRANDVAPGVILMEWDIGPTDSDKEYRHNLVSTDEGKIALKTPNKKEGYTYNIDAEFEVGEWVNFRLEYHFGDMPEITKDGYVKYADGTTAEDYFYVITYANGTPIAVTSINYNNDLSDGHDSFRFYCYGSSYEDFNYSIANAKFEYVDEVATIASALAQNPELHTATLATIEEGWIATEKMLKKYAGITDEGVDEFMQVLREFNELYAYEGHEVWRWIANLYDPEVGGFYFSNSARDTYGFLPDLETTGQIHAVLRNLGVINHDTDALPTAEARAKLASWIMSLQSNEDGFFYHPQWGTDVSTSRRSRDYGKLSYIKTYLGVSKDTALFDNVAQRVNGKGVAGTATVVPYKSADAQGVAYEIPTVTLRRDVTAMVAKVLVTNTPTGLSGHLASVEVFVNYLEELALSHGLTVDYEAGTVTHNNHNFNSYSFGHIISSQAGQIGLNKDLILVCIDFMNLIQDSMKDYQEDNGLTVTGLWTEKLHYNAINGLLKTSGAYNSLANSYKKLLEAEKEAALEANPDADVSAYEYKGEGKIRYADKAFDSALVALKMDADATGDWLMDNVVDVYNPPNGAQNIISSLKNYYGDNNAEEAEAILAAINAKLADKDTALTILRETKEKVEKFRKQDAAGNYSFSYGVNYSSGTSQGEQASVPNSPEGDVNGTSLAISSRVNTLELLGIPVVKITTNAYLEDYHAIINAKTESAKKNTAILDTDADTTVKFDSSLDAPKPSNSSVTVTVVDGTLKFNETNTNGGGGTTFTTVKKYSADGKLKYVLSGDFKFTKNTKLGTQIFLHNDAGSNILRIDVTQTDSGNTVVLKYYYWSDGSTSSNPDGKVELARVAADEWFNLEIEMTPELYDGANATAATGFIKTTVKQNGKADQTKSIAQAYRNTADLTSFKEFYLYGLSTSTTECYIDNLVCESYVVEKKSDTDGVYYFDTLYVPNGAGSAVVDEEGKTNGNKVLKVQSLEFLSAITLPGNKDNKYTDQVNYNYLEARVIADTYKAGDVIKLVMSNTTGDGQIPIVGVTAKVNDDGTISFYGPGGQALIENLEVAKTLGDKFEMTVKLYYYAESSRMDLVVRYNDMSADAEIYPNGMATAVAAVMTDVVPSGNSAEYSYAAIQVSEGVVIYVDDVFARNYTK